MKAIHLRMEDAVHAKLVKDAKAAKRSLNAHILYLIEAGKSKR